MTILYSKIKDGDFKFSNEREKQMYIEENRNYKGYIAHSLYKTTRERTPDQNAALHLWYELVARELNEAGHTVQIVLEKKIDLDWTKDMVKELLWRPAQKAILKKKSTTKLEKIGEIDTVFDHLNRHLGEKFGIHIPFPNKETKND